MVTRVRRQAGQGPAWKGSRERPTHQRACCQGLSFLQVQCALDSGQQSEPSANAEASCAARKVSFDLNKTTQATHSTHGGYVPHGGLAPKPKQHGMAPHRLPPTHHFCMQSWHGMAPHPSPQPITYARRAGARGHGAALLPPGARHPREGHLKEGERAGACAPPHASRAAAAAVMPPWSALRFKVALGNSEGKPVEGECGGITSCAEVATPSGVKRPRATDGNSTALDQITGATYHAPRPEALLP